MRHLIGIIGFLLFTYQAQAACTGSGVTWSCSAGTSTSEVASALNGASDGATITFAAGSYSWSGIANFKMDKGATLMCASQGACTVNFNNAVLGMAGPCNGTSTKLYRISGFKFQGGSNPIWFYSDYPSCTLHNIRIDHNTFTNLTESSRVLTFGPGNPAGNFYGVVDHNILNNGSSVTFVEFYGKSYRLGPAGTRGTANNMYFEDNSFTITNLTNTGSSCMDSTGSPSVVWRYNDQINCRVATHGTTNSAGIVNLEVYGNDFTCNSNMTDCYRTIHHQGSGEAYIFDNVIRPSAALNSSAIDWLHYRSASPSAAGYTQAVRCDGTASIDGNRPGQYGYPCQNQPGRDPNGVLNPVYLWNNRSGSGARVPWHCQSHNQETPNACGHHVLPNRDAYDAVSASAQTSPTSPFNGSSGMGFGTLANRPTTCTPTSEALDAGKGGVGYWATDAGGDWDKSNGTSNDGALYHCSATNTWSLQYTPYTYPHPLVGGTVPPPPPPVIAAPQNLTVE